MGCVLIQEGTVPVDRATSYDKNRGGGGMKR